MDIMAAALPGFAVAAGARACEIGAGAPEALKSAAPRLMPPCMRGRSVSFCGNEAAPPGTGALRAPALPLALICKAGFLCSWPTSERRSAAAAVRLSPLAEAALRGLLRRSIWVRLLESVDAREPWAARHLVDFVRRPLRFRNFIIGVGVSHRLARIQAHTRVGGVPLRPPCWNSYNRTFLCSWLFMVGLVPSTQS